MNKRNVAGIGCIALGVLSILNFWAPVPMPTVGPSAFISGGLLILLGLFLRMPRGPSGRVEWSRFAALLRSGDDAPKPKAALSRPADPLLTVKVLRLAADSKGRLTVSHTAMGLDVPLDLAQAHLDECALKAVAYIDINDDTGISSYCFPEFLPND
ncbi:MAG TPA: hypothetical protein DCG47_04230 [Spirochaetaceae bacterium]|nr:hypothetical protein [Spirochaetaceae bacterium]